MKIALAIILVAVLQVDDNLKFNQAEQASAAYKFSILGWEAGNLLDKWVYRFYELLSSRTNKATRQKALYEYLDLSQQIQNHSNKINALASHHLTRQSNSITALETELSKLKSRRESRRNEAEEMVEATVSAVLSELGLGSFGPFDYPPVDIRFDNPPKLVVTSPRTSISRSDEALVVPGIPIGKRESIENNLFYEAGLSAIVTEIGGIATYPAIIAPSSSLQDILRTTAHEWIHHYLVFHLKPVGLQALKDPEMLTINETLANLVGREIGNLAYKRLEGIINTPSKPLSEMSNIPGGKQFIFETEMRATRLQVDLLLSNSRVKEAEAYMDERRRTFVENGYYIRKLNQAYFAFYGTYADQPQATNPIGNQMQELRRLIPSLKNFITEVSDVAHPDELDALVKKYRGYKR